MRHLILAMGLVLALCGPTPAEELQVRMVGYTGAFACNTGDRDVWVYNPVGKDIRIKAIETWMGMSEHGVADFWAWTSTYDGATGASMLLAAIGWDHYAEPTTPGNFRKVFSPDWVTLKATHHLHLRAGCQGYPGINGDVALTIEYTVAP